VVLRAGTVRILPKPRRFGELLTPGSCPENELHWLPIPEAFGLSGHIFDVPENVQSSSRPSSGERTAQPILTVAPFCDLKKPITVVVKRAPPTRLSAWALG
jgi:hypothetical protein